MSALTDLQGAVAALKPVILSAVAEIESLKSRLDAAIAAANDGTELAQLSADVAAQAKALNDAVVAADPPVLAPTPEG